MKLYKTRPFCGWRDFRQVDLKGARGVSDLFREPSAAGPPPCPKATAVPYPAIQIAARPCRLLRDGGSTRLRCGSCRACNLTAAVMLSYFPFAFSPSLRLISFQICNGRHGRHASCHQHFRRRAKGDCENEANSKTVGDNCNFGIAHWSMLHQLDHSAAREVGQAVFERRCAKALRNGMS
jgi:hypothetical protein